MRLHGDDCTKFILSVSIYVFPTTLNSFLSCQINHKKKPFNNNIQDRREDIINLNNCHIFKAEVNK